MDKNLLPLLACPRCKGKLVPERRGEGLSCPACQLTYPVRDEIPILLVEEGHAGGGIGVEPSIGNAERTRIHVRFQIVEGENKGDLIELEKGCCRAIGRSLEDQEKTKVFSVGSALSLDEVSKKLVMNYIAKQNERDGAPSRGEGESFGAFRRISDVTLRDTSVSRLHAMLFFGEAGVGVLDLVSKNGTFVNGAEVESRILKKGDLLTIGATKIRYES